MRADTAQWSVRAIRLQSSPFLTDSLDRFASLRYRHSAKVKQTTRVAYRLHL